MASRSLPLGTTQREAPATSRETVPPLFSEKVRVATPKLPPTEELLDQIRALLEQSQPFGCSRKSPPAISVSPSVLPSQAAHRD